MYLTKNENLYRDPVGGGWIAEVLLYPNDPDFAEWYKLGTYGSRASAYDAIVRARKACSKD